MRTLLACIAVLSMACDKPAPLPDAGTAAPSSSTKLAVPAKSTPKPVDVPVPEDLSKPPADAQKTASGLVTKVLKKGDGKTNPGPESKVKADYSGWTADGKMFASTVKRGKPVDWTVNELEKGWAEGVQLMVAGEKRRLWIPAELAYGKSPRMIGAPAGDLVLDIELISISGKSKPLPAPDDVAAPPKDAIKTASGLRYKVLEAGKKGDRSPGPSDRVQVHYTGWKKDGEMFDSSVAKGRPSSFSVGGVIKGWTEGLQLMKEGDKVRFWIPSNLAYGDSPGGGKPAGDLVFDVELIAIK